MFPPEPVVSVCAAWDVYTHLKEKGVEVTVLCPGPSRYSGKWSSSDDPKDVVRLDSFTCKESSLVRRLRESWSFGREVIQNIRATTEPFLSCYLIAWPVFGVYFSARPAVKRNIRVVHHVQDVYPEPLGTKLRGWKYYLAFHFLMLLEKRTA